jgi:RNA polymerase sigma factor (sigma-70 family)
MDEVQQPLDVAAVIDAQAYGTALRFPGVAEADDLVQEGWIWVLEHPAKVKEYEQQENPKFAAHALGQDIWKVMDRYARREKAARGGYQPDDEIFMSDAVINVVLPSVLKDDPTPPVRDGERVANTSDPAEGGGWLATYMDVKHAWEKADLTGQQRDLLVSYYLHEDTQAEIATQLKLSQQAVGKRLKQARAKLIDKLGGRNPREREE